MTDNAIVVENLCKRYQVSAVETRHDTLRDHLTHSLNSFLGRTTKAASETFWALRDVSFAVARGEVIGVIGANGAGKSTLLKILSRITEPTSGSAVIRGRVASLLEVGTGFQAELSGRENVYLSGAILGMRKAEIRRKFDEIIEFSGIGRFIETPVKRYSSGMYVRLAFAVAAHLEPEVMFIDEVLAVGDVGFQRKCLAKMEDVARGGRTILFVSHNLAAVSSLCPRSLLLSNGMLTGEGPSDEIVTRYRNQFDPSPRQLVEKIPPDPGCYDCDERFSLSPKNQNTHLEIACGEPLAIEFDVESPDELAEATVGVTIVAGDERIVSMSSKVQNIAPMGRPSRLWRVHCAMGRIPLNAGNYFAHVYFGNGARDVARFSRAFAIRVREHDVFGWGNSLPPRTAWGSMYWAPQWRIQSVDERVLDAQEMTAG